MTKGKIRYYMRHNIILDEIIGRNMIKINRKKDVKKLDRKLW